MNSDKLNRTEKFAVGLFGVVTVLVVVPGLVLIAVSIFNRGSIYLPY